MFCAQKLLLVFDPPYRFEPSGESYGFIEPGALDSSMGKGPEREYSIEKAFISYLTESLIYKPRNRVANAINH